MYGGKWVALVSLMITLVYRSVLGGTGFYSILLSFSILMILTGSNGLKA
ncbi:hypothetical protein [Guptibacillus hwajinpoensis]